MFDRLKLDVIFNNDFIFCFTLLCHSLLPCISPEISLAMNTVYEFECRFY